MQKNQNGKLEVFKVVGGTSTSILSQTISTNGNYSYTVTPGENLMRVVFSGTSAGNFYVDNIVIDEFTYTELYSTDFETTTIVQPELDGWLCDLSTVYLTADAPIGQEERLIVMGTSTSGAYQYFAATPGNDFTLSYNLAFLGAVGTMQVEIYEQNPGGPLTYLTNGSVSSNGAHTLSFTPTMSEIYVHFASNNTFALNEIELSYEYEQMFVNYAGQSGDYRYGFQGQERDNEIKGEGNSINYKFRMHDPRLGRFMSVDPLASAFPNNSPYAFSENVVINAVELEGLEKVYVYNVYKKYGMTIRKLSHTYIDENLTDHRRVYRYFNEKGEKVKTVNQDIGDHERNPNKSFYENMISSKWDDGDYWGAFVWKVKKIDQDVKDPVEGGKLIAATVGTILSGGTLGAAVTAGGFWTIASSSVGLVISLDEFSGVGEKETFLESSIRNKLGDNAAGVFKGAKLALSIKDAAKGITNLTVIMATGETIDGVYNAIEGTLNIGDVIFSVFQETNDKKADKKE